MSDCCAQAQGAACSPPESKPGVCPSCNTKGKQAATITVKSLVRDHARVPADATFSFCRTPDCETVYFSQQIIFQKPDLKVRVGIKELEDPIPVCYCFEYTRTDIYQEIEHFGKTDIPNKIKSEVQAGFCACEVKNPAGTCCLGYVSQVIQNRVRAMQESDTASAH